MASRVREDPETTGHIGATKIEMATTARRISGLRAKRNGQNFEMRFMAACNRYGVSATRIPDGCRRVGARQLIPVKSPFDFVLSYQGKSAMIDTKSYSDKMPHSGINEDQVRSMLGHELQGSIAGYVIYLREEDVMVFTPASALLAKLKVRGSIGIDDPQSVRLGTPGEFKPRLIFSALAPQACNDLGPQ